MQLPALVPLFRHACLLALALLASCSSLPHWMPGSTRYAPASIKSEDYDKAMRIAREAQAAGEHAKALDWMLATRETEGLSPEQREASRVLLEEAAKARVLELDRPGGDAGALADVSTYDLPRQIAVDAGLRAARRYVEEGEHHDGFLVLKKLDTRFPMHHERQAAGDLMIEMGLALKDDDDGFFGLFETVDEAQEILEYAILNAPWARRCDEGYAALCAIYAKERRFDLAIERAGQLVLNHPESSLRARHQLLIPQLRLDSLLSPEYDRQALVQARVELIDWMRTFPDDALLAEARGDLVDCNLRLYESDMLISRFYARVESPWGARFHALRAIDEAREAGATEREAEARQWLADLPPAPAGLRSPEEVRAAEAAATGAEGGNP
jgi:hypothetical protein